MKFHEPSKISFDSDDGSDFIPCTIKNGANKKTNFEKFLRDQYSTVSAKYSFLSSQQIKKRILDMWKKNPQLQEKLNKKEKSNNKNKTKGLIPKSTNYKDDTRKQTRPPSKGKVLVPLNVDVFPTPVKGALKSGEEKENWVKRRVSFSNEPEIRYRTASEASSNSTLKSNIKAKKNSKNSKVFHSNVQYRTYSTRVLKVKKQNNSPLSEKEKNFDELLNDKCSWSYKTLKTITMETKIGSNSMLQSANASKMSMENEDDNFIIPASFNLNESENTNDGNESEKSVNYETEENAEVLIEPNCRSGLPFNNIASHENEVISCKSTNTTDINNDAGIKKCLRQVECKSYAESDMESNAYSSSDEEVVLQTRIYNEDGKPISNVPEDNSSHTGEQTEPTNNESDNFNKFCNDNSDDSNYGNEQYEKFDLPSGKEVNTIIPAKGSNHNINYHADEKDTACLETSFTKNMNPKNKFAPETSSFELSSLSEAGDELLTGVRASSTNETKIYKKDTTNLYSEIVQRCLDISSEVHSMCDDIETSDTSTLNVIVHDFFSGTLDVNKYEIHKRSPKNATISKEMYETEQNSMNKEKKILNVDETCVSIPETRENTNKSKNNKALDMKHISKKEASTTKNKKLPTVHVSKNNSNDKQKNKVHDAKQLKNHQSFNRTIGTKIKNEDPLSHGKLSYLKQDNNNNKNATKCLEEAMIDKSMHLYRVNEVEPREKRIEKDKKDINQNTSKGERKARNVSLNNSHLFTDESEIMQHRRLTSKHLINNSPYKKIRDRQLPNKVSTNPNQISEINMELINSEDTKPPYIAKNTNMKKRPKTWDDLENVFSNEITYDSYTLQNCYKRPTSTSKKDESTANAVNVHGIINKQNKKACIQTNVANDFSVASPSLRNKNNTILKKNTELTPKTVSKRNNELALISPNANIINKIMKSMEECTLPYLTSSQERQSTSLNDSETNNDSNKSPIVTEYSYSIKEIQSTIRFTAGKTNSEEQLRNLIQSEDKKTRLCQISHKSVSNKNYNVQKQETTFKALSMSKDRGDDKSPVAIKFNAPRLTQKQLLNKKNESKTSKENNKHNTLNNILARLEVDHNMYDSQKDNNFVDKKTKLSKGRNIINKTPPDLKASMSPMESRSLSPEQVEQGHYNLRKRKCTNYMEEIDNNQSSKKKLYFYPESSNSKSNSVTNHKSTRTKQSKYWNDESTCNTDSSCEIIDIPEQKSNQTKAYQKGRQLKVVEIKNSYSKSKDSSRPLPKKEATKFGKKVTRKYKEPLNTSDDSNVDTEGSIYEIGDLNIQSITNKTQSELNPISPHSIEDDTFDKSNTDSSFDMFDFPKESNIQLKRNQNRNHSKITKVKDSKSNLSKYPSSSKKNRTEFEKHEAFLSKSKCQKSQNDGTTNVDSKNGSHGKIDNSKNMLNNELLSNANSSYCSNKIPQTDMKTTTHKNQHLHSGKEGIFHHDFPQKQTKLSSNFRIKSSNNQNLKKSQKEDSYKTYLETMFKNGNQKTSTHRNASSTIQEQKRRESTWIEDSEENELFSLSSSDSEDCEMPTRKTGLGLLDDTLCRDNEEE